MSTCIFQQKTGVGSIDLHHGTPTPVTLYVVFLVPDSDWVVSEVRKWRLRITDVSGKIGESGRRARSRKSQRGIQRKTAATRVRGTSKSLGGPVVASAAAPLFVGPPPAVPPEYKTELEGKVEEYTERRRKEKIR